MHSWLPVTLCLACTTAAAQLPQDTQGSQPTATPQGTPGRTSIDVHTESGSRELFAACDGDSDDRLDLFEACEAIDTLGDPIDSSSFRALDTNRDGYLGWPEFDTHFRGVIERGNTFRVRTCRRFVQSAPELQEAKTATPLEIFLQLHDANENGGLDPDEVGKIVREMGLLPVFEAQLRTLDLDQNGRIEALELAPWFDKIRAVTPLPGVGATPAPSTLPQPWALIDSNGDGVIDVTELQTALRRLDPGLARWAKHLLQQHDLDKDGRLGTDELPGTKLPAAATPAKAPGETTALHPPTRQTPGLAGVASH